MLVDPALCINQNCLPCSDKLESSLDIDVKSCMQVKKIQITCTFDRPWIAVPHTSCCVLLIKGLKSAIRFFKHLS